MGIYSGSYTDCVNFSYLKFINNFLLPLAKRHTSFNEGLGLASLWSSLSSTASSHVAFAQCLGCPLSLLFCTVMWIWSCSLPTIHHLSLAFLSFRPLQRYLAQRNHLRYSKTWLDFLNIFIIIHSRLIIFLSPLLVFKLHYNGTQPWIFSLFWLQYVGTMTVQRRKRIIPNGGIWKCFVGKKNEIKVGPSKTEKLV